MKEQQHKRIIISGGGTGGHIFPAISIANALRQADPEIKILFVGAEGRMEMEKVPAAGYEITGLPVSGFIRSFSLKNVLVISRLFRSLRMASEIIRNFKPDVVVGVGGYASGPVLRQAGRMGISTLIQEQNSYAGVTNKLLARRAAKICVAYDGMERYFPADKIVFTGNPVRHDILVSDEKITEGLDYFGLKNSKPVLLVLGGSLGSATINRTIVSGIEKLEENGFQVIWQTGKYYFEKVSSEFDISGDNHKIMGFIDRMDLAYSVSDIIISRAGAGTISELCLTGKPVILVPSPNVAEDHQKRNSEALTGRNAALMVSDAEAPAKLVDIVIDLNNNTGLKTELSRNIAAMAIDDSDRRISDEIMKLTV
ncbi:MAG: undecaprenyldiphospho-muramoylpentapeptide beta-N-acetylglucosaminyltransferase [Bacteroidales bacterium]|nr:undecaprenyldiphospho-muramoylpentapeptide beta-N-acetylglucosaminyltransferase [Bacteroidales bacterium]